VVYFPCTRREPLSALCLLRAALSMAYKRRRRQALLSASPPAVTAVRREAVAGDGLHYNRNDACGIWRLKYRAARAALLFCLAAAKRRQTARAKMAARSSAAAAACSRLERQLHEL